MTRKRLKRWSPRIRVAERFVSIPGMVDDAKTWMVWLGKMVKFAGLPFALVAREWVMDNLLAIIVYGAATYVSFSGAKGLYQLATEKKRRIKNLIPYIREGREYIREAQKMVRDDPFWRLDVIRGLTKRLDLMEIPHPSLPGNVANLDEWRSFLAELEPLAEQGLIEDARRLL